MIFNCMCDMVGCLISALCVGLGCKRSAESFECRRLSENEASVQPNEDVGGDVFRDDR